MKIVIQTLLVFIALLCLPGPDLPAEEIHFPYVGLGEGLTGHYYQNYAIDTLGQISFSGLTESFSRIDSVIKFWNQNQYYVWGPVPGWSNYYCVQWLGYIYIEKTGPYGFGTISDDGSEIWIDDSLIVKNNELQWYDWEDNLGESDTSGAPFQPLMLDSGFHSIDLRFYEDVSYDGIELWWLTPDADSSDIPYYGTNFHGIPPTYNPNTNWQIIPKSVLYTVPDTISSVPHFKGETKSPASIQLEQNFPNPFNPQTTISFSLPYPAFVSLTIYNITGEQVMQLISADLSAGEHQVAWNAGNLPGGVYFYRLQSNKSCQVRKALLIK